MTVAFYVEEAQVNTRKPRPSMAEVAKVAGVSHQTVSRVINGFPGVRPATRERIEAAINQTGYRRNSAARTLVTRKSGLIGVIAVGSFLYGPTSTLAAIDEAARKHGYTILLHNLGEGVDSEFRAAVDACLDRAAEAIVVLATREELVDQLEAMQIDVPILAVGPAPRHLPKISCLSVDQWEGAKLALEHLIGLGHRDITIVSGPANWTDSQRRLAGAKRTCEEAGITPTIYEGDWSAAYGYELGQKLASAHERLPSAIFAANDHMALGLISAFHENGITLPEQVSIVGFDDVPESAYYTPSLTTIHQDFATLGQRVLMAALALLNDEEPDTTPVGAWMCERQSTARPATSAS